MVNEACLSCESLLSSGVAKSPHKNEGRTGSAQAINVPTRWRSRLSLISHFLPGLLFLHDNSTPPPPPPPHTHTEKEDIHRERKKRCNKDIRAKAYVVL
jgi:hypothetical protein